jgi:hypothetical protein
MRVLVTILIGLVLWTTTAGQERVVHPQALARWLAEQRVPTGFVLPHDGFERGRNGGGKQNGLGDDAKEAVLRRFAAEHPLLVVGETRGGTVHVAHLDQPAFITRLLQREQHLTEPVSTQAGDVLHRVLPDLVPLELRGWGGVVPGTESPGGSCRLGERVSLTSGATTVRLILDAVVEQQPGLVWFLTYDAAVPERHVKIGLMCPGEAATLDFGNRFLGGPLLTPSPPPPPPPRP